jgi:Holliday junction resolvasome RuvABC endonuclease subunit
MTLPPPFRTIGIDVGTSLGWAVYDGSTVLDSGQADLKASGWEGIGMRPFRAAVVVGGLLARYPGSVVVIELVRRHLGTQAAQVYGAILGAITSTVEGSGGARYTFVSVGDAKIEATGYGAAKKAGMVDAARVAFGIDAGEDQADAIWIAVAGWNRENSAGLFS